MSELAGLDRRIVPAATALISLLRNHGVRVEVTSVRRSQAKQAKLYREYLTAKAEGRPHLPALPPGHSLHEHGLAWDMVLDPPVYPVAGKLWERIGGQWGGHASVGYDPVHFQVKQLG